MTKLARFSISIDTKLLKHFDELVKKHEYTNRSEAFRDIIREKLIHEEWETDEIETVGTLTIIYNHHQHNLQDSLTTHQHQHHESVISTMHVHLDHDNCLEVMVIRGNAKKIKTFADELISTKGVKHGKLVMTSMGKNL